MVQDLERSRQTYQLPESAPAANPVFFRTYSRRDITADQQRESWEDVCKRTLLGLVKLGNLSETEADLIARMQSQLKSMPSGRWLWVGGGLWIERPENFSGAYNCTSTNVIDWRAFGLMMDLAMMGCGTGAMLEPKYISQLPAIRNHLKVVIQREIGTVPASERQELTEVTFGDNQATIRVGDSRQGWVKSYQTLLELSTDERFTGDVQVMIDLSHVRPAGEKLKGFGGVANPIRLPALYERCTNILNKAIGRQLGSVECCLLIDEAAACVVAGNIRRCLPEDALVHTAKGLVPIKAVQVGDLVQTPLGFRKVVNKFDQGLQDVYEMDTNATSPRATLNHKYAVLANASGGITWKPVSQLSPGDRLMHSTQILSGTVTHLPPIGATTPDLTPEIAWLIGLTHGKGYVSHEPGLPYGRIEWTVRGRTPQVVGRIREKISAALAQFGATATHGFVQEDYSARSFCNDLALVEYFHRYIKQPNLPTVVPAFILQGSIDIRAAYLAGLMDSEGTANRPSQLLSTAYSAFARQVAAVLSSLGIAGRIKLMQPPALGWQAKYSLSIPALKDRYNALIAPHSARGHLRQSGQPGFSMPNQLMRRAYSYREMQAMGFADAGIVTADYEQYRAESAVELDIPVTVKGLGSYDHVQTYDIEVEEAHCFYCDGYLTHNSAGMRQGDSTDRAFAEAKENLWQQDAEGNWRIDPERDVLRMANHTRVFHVKPTREECVEAVRKQFYSGEGAIQWAGEAVARANCDLLTTPDLKTEFLSAYSQGQGRDWLQSHHPEMPETELQHRLGRYGLNPCVTADTWVHTGEGARQVKDLIGQQHSTYVNGELFSTTPEGFFFSGVKPVVKLSTQEGYVLRLTANHKVLKVTAQTQKAQYSEWVEAGSLQSGDRILLHNHRDLQPWEGMGSAAEGWLLGSLVGDGSLATTQWNDIGHLRFWQDSLEMSQHAVALLQSAVGYVPKTELPHYHTQLKHRSVTSTGLAKLAAQFGIIKGAKRVTAQIEQASYDFYCGFLRGLFDADASVQGTQLKGVSLRLAQSSLGNLQAVQRMLARLGIISTIYQRRPAGERMLPDSQRQPAPYFCQTQYELVIANDNLPYFHTLIGFQEPQKAAKLQALLDGYKRNLNRERFTATVIALQSDGEEAVYDCTVPGPARFDANGLVAHNCGEIIGENFHCNLAEIHLNQLDPADLKEQEEAFTAGALSVASLLNHRFQEPRYRYSRQLDPIVGVSFTGLFDFFVQAFGSDWLRWWEQGRPDTVTGLQFRQQEQDYLSRWKETVHRVVWDYCDRHGLKRPNRCTTVQPAGTKSLLTGASPGWHPPKAQRFIRRITFRKNDPVALACLEYGYKIVPSQSDKDENGRLLDDAFDPRCTEWLVEIPVEVSWANLPGADEIEISKFSALAQMDFYMQVQKHFTAHNTSATIELREAEVEMLAERIYQAVETNEGYISAALLARFDDHQTFPRLPFEPISKAEYEQLSQEVLMRRRTDDFQAALRRYDSGELFEAGPAGCDSDKCMLPEQK